LEALVKIHGEDDKVIPCLENAALLISMLDQAYFEPIYPTSIAKAIFNLIHKNGLTKIQNAVVAMNLHPAIYRKVIKYFEYAELFRVPGCND
jgi:hypothetical protein